jgi:hypothetical protein
MRRHSGCCSVAAQIGLPEPIDRTSVRALALRDSGGDDAVIRLAPREGGRRWLSRNDQRPRARY